MANSACLFFVHTNYIPWLLAIIIFSCNSISWIKLCIIHTQCGYHARTKAWFLLKFLRFFLNSDTKVKGAGFTAPSAFSARQVTTMKKDDHSDDHYYKVHYLQRKYIIFCHPLHTSNMHLFIWWLYRLFMLQKILCDHFFSSLEAIITEDSICMQFLDSSGSSPESLKKILCEFLRRPRE